MRTHRSTPPSAQAAVSSRGGCLSGFLVPPLAVILVGILLAGLTISSIGPTAPGSYQPGYESVTGEPYADTNLAVIFTIEVQYWAGDILRWASRTGLDPDLIATVMQIESCGDPRALSPSGAMGLFQVMPFHFTADDNPYDPDTNSFRGMGYLLRSLETAGGNIRLALAGYNGGISVIGWDETSWPSETQRYAYWGAGIYQEAKSGLATSPRLQEWLQAGGSSLCHQAQRRLGINP
ncbi:MAG: transglycosylase SLT domain-containing protein [Chloroflexota bacterium]